MKGRRAKSEIGSELGTSELGLKVENLLVDASLRVELAETPLVPRPRAVGTNSPSSL